MSAPPKYLEIGGVAAAARGVSGRAGSRSAWVIGVILLLG